MFNCVFIQPVYILIQYKDKCSVGQKSFKLFSRSTLIILKYYYLCSVDVLCL